MKTRFTVEAFALVGMAAGLAVTSGCRTTYSDSADLSLTPMPASLEPEPVGNVTYPAAEAEKAMPYWQQHPEAVAALDKAPAATATAAKVGTGYSTYVVKPGESLSKIAVAHGFRTADVLAVNPGINANKIRAGQTIVLPGAESAKVSSAAPAAPKAASVAGGTYVVQKGDILGRIANKHGVKVSDLKKANGLTSDKIIVGQKLVIPGATATPAKSEKKEQAKPAKPAKPAQQSAIAPAVTKVPTPAPKPVSQPAPKPVSQPEVKPVQQPAIAPVVTEVAPPAIATPAPAAIVPPPVEATPPAAKGTPYTVQEGQDLFDISVKWGVSATEIKALNNLTSDDVTPGQTLMIPAPRAE